MFDYSDESKAFPNSQSLLNQNKNQELNPGPSTTPMIAFVAAFMIISYFGFFFNTLSRHLLANLNFLAI